MRCSADAALTPKCSIAQNEIMSADAASSERQNG